MKLIPFQNKHIDEVSEIFESNIPYYFHESEKAEFLNFLNCPDILYFVLKDATKIIGAGGIGENKDGTVSLCWGMIHKEKHGKGFGTFLVRERINLCEKYFPNQTIITYTSQLTEEFFRKFGFKTIEAIEDYWVKGIHLRKMVL